MRRGADSLKRMVAIGHFVRVGRRSRMRLMRGCTVRRGARRLGRKEKPLAALHRPCASACSTVCFCTVAPSRGVPQVLPGYGGTTPAAAAAATARAAACGSSGAGGPRSGGGGWRDGRVAGASRNGRAVTLGWRARKEQRRDERCGRTAEVGRDETGPRRGSNG